MNILGLLMSLLFLVHSTHGVDWCTVFTRCHHNNRKLTTTTSLRGATDGTRNLKEVDPKSEIVAHAVQDAYDELAMEDKEN